jgi:hypothetical protein
MILAAGVCALAACRQPGSPELDYQNTTPPEVLSTVPPLPDAGTSVSWSAGIQVTFSEEMDPDTLTGGIQLFAPPSAAGGMAVQVPTVITLISAVEPYPPYAQLNPPPYVVLVQQGVGGGFCLPDGGTYGCFEAPANYDLRLTTQIADTTGLSIPAQIDVLFSTVPE